MQIPVERWLKAIEIRQSWRSYNGKKIDAELLAGMAEMCADFQPFAGVRTELVDAPADHVFTGMIGSYGKITGAPAYLAFIGDTEHPDIEGKVGYVGEGLILEATARGLNTCWVAGFFDPAEVEKDISLGAKERVFAVTPLGYANTPAFAERLTRRAVKARKRFPLDKIVPNLTTESWPDWALTGLQAARLAPSAVNRQPWRFAYSNGEVIVSTDNGQDTVKVSKRLDCGIAMLHFELAALSKEIPGEWRFLSRPQVAKFITASF